MNFYTYFIISLCIFIYRNKNTNDHFPLNFNSQYFNAKLELKYRIYSAPLYELTSFITYTEVINAKLR